MSDPVKILILDDIVQDADLIEQELFKNDLDIIIKKTANELEYIFQLEAFSPDLVLSSFNLPQFTGLDALKKVNEIIPNTPFIIVTTSLNEEIAVQCIKEGAWDYVLKDNISRLNRSVNNALSLRTEKHKKEISERALKENIIQLQGILNSLHETLIIVYDDEGNHKFVWGSAELDERYGIFASDLLGKSLSVLYSPADAIERINDIKTVYRTGETIRGEIHTLCPKGKFWHDSSLTPMRDSNGKVVGVVSFLLDITERKKSEEIQVQLATAIEQVAECIVITDTNANIIYVNPAIEHVTGYTRNEIINQNCRIFQSGKHDHDFYKNLWRTILSGHIWNGHIINKKKNGNSYEEEVTISPIRDHNGTIINYVSVKRDVTDEIRLEKQLHQAQKMEAIGTLAGGIAHDFNNILAAILGYTELSLRELDENTRLHRNLQQVLQAGYRAKDLIKQILAFSRQGKQERTPLQISLIVKEALKLLRASLPTTIEIRQNITAKSSIVMADPTQIHQVLMNLCTNAAHSMREKGGIMEVSLVEVEVTQMDTAHFHSIKPGPYIKLSVKDTGHGMMPDILERIFEPYFTTKKPGEGTGMGLSVVHGIVKSHGGEISVYSEPSKGTSFHIILPRLNNTIEENKDSESPVPHGKERIMFVDDEKSLVNIGKEMLEQLGYKVLAFTESIEALEIFKKYPNEFDLIVTDQTMPLLTGAEMAKQMIRLRPDIPIILCTGFSEVITADKAKAIGIKEFIMKPIFMKEIAFAIRRILDT